MIAKGILFDLDGTLVNSLPAVERCWLKFAERHKLDPNYVLRSIHGRKAIDNVKLFLPNQSEDYIAQEFVWIDQLESQDLTGVEEIPGASSFLQKLSELNVPWGIVTSGTKYVAESRYGVLKQPKPAIFITGETITNSKPAPDGYLLGAKLLGLPTKQCIVFEDSIAGIESAFNANCKVVGVRTRGVMEDKTDFCIQSFSELTIKKVTSSDVVIEKK